MTVPRPRDLRDTEEFIRRDACIRETPTAPRNSSTRRLELSAVLVVPVWEVTSWISHFEQRLLAWTLVASISVRFNAAVISKCRAAPCSEEVWMLVSRQMVTPSKIVACSNVMPCGLVFSLMIFRTALLVGFDGMVSSLFTITCLLIILYSGEYSAVPSVFLLF